MYLFTLYLQDYSNEIVEVFVILEIIWNLWEDPLL